MGSYPLPRAEVGATKPRHLTSLPRPSPVDDLSWTLSTQLPGGFARAYAYGVLAGVIATVFAGFLVDWVLPFVYNIGFTGFRASILPWIFCGALVSMERTYSGKKNGLVSTRFQ